MDVDAIQAKCILVDDAVEPCIAWPSDRLSPFGLPAPVSEFAQEIDHEAFEENGRHFSLTIKQVGLECAGEYLIALAYLFLGGSGGFASMEFGVYAIWFARKRGRTPLTPLNIAREPLEEAHVNLGGFLGENIQSHLCRAVSTSTSLLNQTSSLQKNICPSGAVSERGLPPTRQHLAQICAIEL